MSMQGKEKKNPKLDMVKHKHDMGIISFICSMVILSLLLINSIWFVPTILNKDFLEKGINVLNNVSAVLIVVMLSQMYRF